jgi:hypothetical protein
MPNLFFSTVHIVLGFDPGNAFESFLGSCQYQLAMARLHEYQGKAILAANGFKIPRGRAPSLGTIRQLPDSTT